MVQLEEIEETNENVEMLNNETSSQPETINQDSPDANAKNIEDSISENECDYDTDDYVDEDEFDEQESRLIQQNIQDNQDTYEDESENDFENETVFERICALVDIVPPTTRAKISNSVSTTIQFGSTAVKTVGNLCWILATGILLAGLPIGIELEREGVMMQQQSRIRNAAQ